LTVFPPHKYSFRRGKAIHLAAWLIEASKDDVHLLLTSDQQATRPAPHTIRLLEFLCFLSPNTISHHVVDFLSMVWNKRALPEWVSIPPTQATRLIAREIGSDLDISIRLAVSGSRLGLQYQNVVLPIPTATKVFGLHLSLRNHLATIYTWEPDHQEGFEDDDTNRVLQVVRNNDWFDEWNLVVKGTGPQQEEGGAQMDALSFNDSYLAYLHFAHTVCTGGRFFTESVSEVGVPANEVIIGACLGEAFFLAQADEEGEEGEEGEEASWEMDDSGISRVDVGCFGFELMD
jgi:hypothetical protein